jgi:hypothetical protein
MKLLFLLQAKDMELTGFKEGINGLQRSITNKTGVQTVLKLDSTNILIYEAKIPFAIFTSDLTKAEPFAVGFILKGLERPKIQEGEDAHGGGMENRKGSGGIGGGYGGEGRDGHGGGGYNRQGSNRNETGEPGNNPRQMMFEDTSMWIKLSVAH